MKSKTITGKIFFPGGIVSPGDLRKIASTAYHYGMTHLRLGSRQEMYLEFPERNIKEISIRLKNTQYQFYTDFSKRENVVSTYPVRNITASTKWLNEGIYRDVLASFTDVPGLKINLCDPLQGMLPLFGGQLNFVASPYDNYWFLYLKLKPGGTVHKWPVLVDSKEIYLIAREVEEVLKNKPEIEFKALEDLVYNSREWTFRTTDEVPNAGPGRFFNYEGLHSMGENRFWLGIYERLNQYPVLFLEALAMLANQTDIGSISFTPYKSLIIKNIREEHVGLWEELLGKFKINTCHSSLEVNFTIPDLDTEALKLRKFIFSVFDDREVRSEGLVFSLHADKDSYGSVLVEKNSRIRLGKFSFWQYYTIKYRKEFNCNSHEIISFAGYVKKRDVPEILMYLCEQYYEQLSNQKKRVEKKPEEKKVKLVEKQIFHCSACGTRYDHDIGDMFNDIPVGIPFELLPDSFKCSLCEAPKSAYVLLDNFKEVQL
ncbi:MAG: rubredoxin [Cytophagaceae bacterium]